MGLGLLTGLAGGQLIILVVNRLKLEAGLYPIVVLSLALCLFAATGMIGGSGFLAVYVAGLTAGNSRLHALAMLRRFQNGMTWFSQIAMFLTLGLLATPSQFPDIALPAVLLALFLTLDRATDRRLDLPAAVRIQPQRDDLRRLGRAARRGVDPAGDPADRRGFSECATDCSTSPSSSS